MKFNLYSLHDRTGAVYLAPFVARSDIDAARNIRASKADPQLQSTPVGQNPSDFFLARVGSFDDDTGIISGVSPVHLQSVAVIWMDLQPVLTGSAVVEPSSTVSP